MSNTNIFTLKMGNIIRYIGVILCFQIGIRGKEVTLRVGLDKEVKIGDSVSLECFGSEPQLVYYFSNKFIWSFTGMSGLAKNLTDGFNVDPSVQHEFHSGNYLLDYETLNDNEFRYRLNITNIRHTDDGIYSCSLYGEKGGSFDRAQLYVSHQESVRVTVLNPVQRVKLQIRNVPGASSTTPIVRYLTPIRVMPGEYRVHCEAAGSNPAPVMGLLYNEEQYYVTPKYSHSTAMKRMRYTADFEVTVNIEASLGREQTIVCYANVPNKQFATVESGLKLLVSVVKPEIRCANISIKKNYNRAKLTCYITVSSGPDILTCNKVFWELPETQTLIPTNGDISKTRIETKNMGILEGSCQRVAEGLETTLRINTVQEKHFQTIFFVQYDDGTNFHRVPLQIRELKDVSSANITFTVPAFLIYIAMTVISKLTGKYVWCML